MTVMSYPPQHQPPQYVVQIQSPPSNGQAIAALVLGIIGAAVGVWAFVPLLGVIAAMLGFIPALLAVILGHLGMRASQRMQGAGRGQSITGLVLGYLTLGIIVATTMLWIVALAVSAASS